MRASVTELNTLHLSYGFETAPVIMAYYVNHLAKIYFKIMPIHKRREIGLYVVGVS
jgi:hypothetical protein